MKAVQEIAVAEEETDVRLDRWFRRRFPHITNGQLQKMLRTGQVRIDGKRSEANRRLIAGQIVRVPPLPDPQEREPTPRPVSERDAADLRARVIHRDAHVLAIDKPYGLAVQGGTKQARHLDAMLDALQFDAAERPRLVHRLDRDTTGALVLARTVQSASALAAAFRGRDVRKLYWAITIGVPNPPDGTIDLPLAKKVGRPGQGEERMAVDRDHGQPAHTRFRVLDQAGDRFALVALEPLTGRTHQLRVHCAAIGTPILGDMKYGAAGDPDLPGHGDKLHLHAFLLQFPAMGGRKLRVKAPLPDHFRATLRFLGLQAAAKEDFLPL